MLASAEEHTSVSSQQQTPVLQGSDSQLKEERLQLYQYKQTIYNIRKNNHLDEKTRDYSADSFHKRQIFFYDSKTFF